MSKVFAISSTGKTGKSFLDLRFGKCENVVLYNKDNDNYTILENPYKDKQHSGIQLVKYLKEEGVNTIITGEVGPMVSALLEKEKIQLVLLNEEKIKIDEIIAKMKPKS